MIFASRSSLSAPGGMAIINTLLRSREIFWLPGARHWPLASSTVKPSGKRGVTSAARKRAHFVSLTRVRPNSRSATTQDFCAPLHCGAGCAPAVAIPTTSTSSPIAAAPARKMLSAHPLDRSSAGAELVLQPLEAAVEVIDAVD